MNEVEQKVLAFIEKYIRYKQSTKVLPVHVYHHEILTSMQKRESLAPEEVNKALRGLLDAGKIQVGRTINYIYIALPE